MAVATKAGLSRLWMAVMKARIKWVEDRTFIGESGSGHKIVLGTAFGPEGRSPGPSPMELVLIGLGGCSGYDVVNILAKGREAIEDVTVELEAERAQQDPRVFTHIHMHFVVKGRGLAADKVERAIALSAEKYCSASAMIAKSATITHDFEVVDTTATEAGTH
jgi:putative redox protein